MTRDSDKAEQILCAQWFLKALTSPHHMWPLQTISQRQTPRWYIWTQVDECVYTSITVAVQVYGGKAVYFCELYALNVDSWEISRWVKRDPNKSNTSESSDYRGGAVIALNQVTTNCYLEKNKNTTTTNTTPYLSTLKSDRVTVLELYETNR